MFKKQIALIIAAGIAAFFLSGNIAAMDWPSENGVLVANFGMNRDGRPFLGTVFETEDAVRAVEDGDLLFVHTPGEDGGRLPSPLGHWAAVDHGDGLLSIYGRLDRERPVTDEAGFSRGRAIAGAENLSQAAGVTGVSGRTAQAAGTGRFYFSFYDRKERRWINPSLIIAPHADTVPPTIVSVELKDGSGQVYNPAQARRFSQGNYTVTVNALDSQRAERAASLAPHRIICTVNGLETSALSFETFAARDGNLLASRNGLVPAREVYAPAQGWEAGSFWLARGQAAVEIIVQDAAGNTRSAVYRLQAE